MIQNTIDVAGSAPVAPTSRGPVSASKSARTGSVPVVSHITSTVEPHARDSARPPVTALDRACGVLLVVVLPSAVWFGALWAAARLMGYRPGAVGLAALAASLISLLTVVYSSLNIDRS
jgi:hypothetical protein